LAGKPGTMSACLKQAEIPLCARVSRSIHVTTAAAVAVQGRSQQQRHTMAGRASWQAARGTGVRISSSRSVIRLGQDHRILPGPQTTNLSRSLRRSIELSSFRRYFSYTPKYLDQDGRSHDLQYVFSNYSIFVLFPLPPDQPHCTLQSLLQLQLLRSGVDIFRMATCHEEAPRLARHLSTNLVSIDVRNQHLIALSPHPPVCGK
jgi:hypothetical protein